MKKAVSLILSAVLLLALIQSPVLAADTGLEQAILTAKSKIDIPETYTEFSSNVVTSERQTQYDLTWRQPEKEFVSEASISVTVNDKGDILDYRQYSSQLDSSSDVKLSKYSDDQLKTIAAEWLQAVNPNWMAELPQEAMTVSDPSVSSRRSYVTMPRRVNGIPFCGDSVDISIDNQTGDVLYMQAAWTYTDAIPSLDTVIGDAAAQAAFAALSPLELSYIDAGEDRAVLVYMPTDASVMVDANTGEKVEFNSAANAYAGGSGGGASLATAENAAKDEAAVDRGLSEEELANVEQIEGLLQEDALRAFGAGLTELGLDQAQYVSCTYQRVQEDGETVSYRAVLRYLFIDGEEEREATLTVDAQTCELLSYYTYMPYNYQSSVQEGAEPAVSRADAEQTARAFAEKYAAEQYAKTSLQEPEEDSYYGSHAFTFIRQENDVPFDSHSISMAVDGETGQITRFYKTWDDSYTFEPTEGMLDADAAMQALFTYAPVQLQYENLNGRYSEAEPAVRAIYRMDTTRGTIVGAHSGKLVGWDGQELPEDGTALTADDIAGHYGEAAITALLQAGVIALDPDTTSFRPDDVITQQELLAFVSGLQGSYIPYPAWDTELLRASSRSGLLTAGEWNPTQEENRQDGVKYIIRALGYERVANLQGIFDCGFADRADISDGYEGYVALAKGFGIVNGDENNRFNPQAALTRADAAIMIYNYLAN